ncbi:hypothetical protein K491DRAFT_776845 [Lophiostoma macrostomum CBS 122681]|uniref:Uncharacterized protein n=1 Tax=Lophiostoma macrostomum CBS 122681 TaxID=1314788 RepID=A0A6A6TH48_9PLEO|nr:hypothetical protein K491DRAFT_776845 [Lophiostoma macrostomum CBS 122681]
MAPTRRKSAPSAFKQTWHETDAATFDPAALPLTKVPRAWERKAETTVTTDGKEKKVWRRYTLRSKTTNTTEEEDEEEEQQDSRYRAVKKLQRVRPAEMEDIAAKPKDKKRVFKATRWDRRKSVLPRKKLPSRTDTTTGTEDNPQFDLDEAHALDSGGDGPEEHVIDQDEQVSSLTSLIAVDRRRSTFTFTTEDADSTSLDDELSTQIELSAVSSTALQQTDFATRDEWSASLSNEPDDSFDSDVIKVKYFESEEEDPQQSHGPETTVDHVDVSLDNAEIIEVIDDVIRVGVQEQSPEDTEAQEDLEEAPVDVSQTSLEDNSEQRAEELESILARENPSKSDTSDVREELEDHEMSEITLDLELGALAPSGGAGPGVETLESAPKLLHDDFTLTEASLQLNIEHDMEQESEARQTVAVQASGQDEEMVDTPDVKMLHEFGPIECVVEDLDGDEQDEHSISDATPQNESANDVLNIADGLTLTLSGSTNEEPPEEDLVDSDSLFEANPDDVTGMLQMDDDTALLKDFLTRAAASKANKATVIARRESLQNRRDSGFIRQALASPRKILEDKDPNSPFKYDNDATLDLTQTLTLNMDQQLPASPMPSRQEADTEEPTESKPGKNSRRSSRTRKSKLPAPSSGTSQTQIPKNIAVRRADGGEPIVLKKTEAQELGLQTRTNTRKNKQGAVAVQVRLVKLKMESRDDTLTSPLGATAGKKNVHWDETLAYFQEGTDTIANMLADAASLASPDELAVQIATPSTKKKSKESKDNTTETPRKIKRVRGLGAANGTPGKGLLAPAAMLPEDLTEDDDVPPPPPEKSVRNASRLKKLVIVPTSGESILASPARKGHIPPSPRKAAAPLPPFEITPVGIESAKDSKATRERKSRLATPKRVKLPQPTSAVPSLPVPVDGKENQANMGIRGASPKKGLKLPEVVVPPIAESGLPRRRAGRRL